MVCISSPLELETSAQGVRRWVYHIIPNWLNTKTSLSLLSQNSVVFNHSNIHGPSICVNYKFTETKQTLLHGLTFFPSSSAICTVGKHTNTLEILKFFQKGDWPCYCFQPEYISTQFAIYQVFVHAAAICYSPAPCASVGILISLSELKVLSSLYLNSAFDDKISPYVSYVLL